MEKELVSVVKCVGYDIETLEGKIRESLDLIGFDVTAFQGARVGLKPNLLIPSDVDKAIITHPEFFRAMVRIVKAHGGTPVLIESPSIHSLERTLKKTPYAWVVDSEEVEVADVEKTREVRFEGGVKFLAMDIAEAFFETDILINLPKYKTHGLTYMTGAVKNLFGAIPGLGKSKMHVKLPDREDFADFLLDLYAAMDTGLGRPGRILHVMDAIVAQEGEGPGPSGTPKPMNAILASQCAVALDYTATRIAGLDPDKAPTIVRGFARGVGVGSPEDIRVVGDDPKTLGNSPLRPSRGTFFSNMIRWPMNTRWFKNITIDRPQPIEGTCILCYQCKTICPARAISPCGKNGTVPVFDYGACIRCYCCMEVCPEAAIRKKRGRLQWLSRL